MLRLQGNFFDARGGDGDYELAIQKYEAALKLDPNYARAWTDLSWAIQFQFPRGDFERARRAVQRAIELAPTLADAHATFGWLHELYDHDWAPARAEFDRALAIEPFNARALHGKAKLARGLGRYDESEKLYQMAISRDPLSVGILQGLAHTQINAGRFADAESSMRKALALSPGAAESHFLLGYALLLAGDSHAALPEMEVEANPVMRRSGVAMAEFALGHLPQADAQLAELVRLDASDSQTMIAMVYARRGDADNAMRRLEEAYARKDPFLGAAPDEPAFRSLRNTPRFRALLRKMNLLKS